jgi:general secretion pathway protein G
LKKLGKFRQRSRGFTLIELIMVMAIILILMSIAIPNYRRSVLQAKESVLRDDLYQMRRLIDAYTLDKGKAPQGLEDLVSAGYLPKLPKDPITGQDNSWTYTVDDTYGSADQSEPGFGDVHSGASGTGTDNVPYSEW